MLTRRSSQFTVFMLVAAATACVIPTARADADATLPGNWIQAFQWRSIGPAGMGGRITDMAVFEKDPCIWYVATASGGLLKTANNGITFEHQFDHEATVSIGAVAVAQSDSDIVWVGTGEENPRNSVSWGDGVYKSTDGGKTWKNMGLRESFQIGSIVIHPSNPDIVYVGALGRLYGPNEERGLYKTTDGGKTWDRILFVDDKTGVVEVEMHPTDPLTLLVATYERQRDGFDTNDPAKKLGAGSGLHKTTDGGETFRKITDGLPTGKLGRIGIDYYAKNPDHVYIVLESEKIGKEPENAAYAGFRGRDADAGAKLTEITKDGPAEKAGLKVDDIVLAVNDKTVHSYSDFQTEVRKRLAGDTLEVEVSRERKSEVVEIKLAKRPEPQRGRGNGRGNGARQQRSPFGTRLGGQVQNVQEQQGPDGREFGGLYKSTDGGESWTRINSINPRPMYFSQVRVDPADENYIYVLGVSLHASEDGGKTFNSRAGRGTHADHHAMWIDPADGRHVILGNDGGVYVTCDRMEKWDHLNHVAIGQFYHVGVGPRRDYRVYGGLQDNGSWGGPTRVRYGSGPVNEDWFRVGGGDGFICLVDKDDADQVYFESQNGSTGRINLRTGDRGFIRPGRQRGARGAGGRGARRGGGRFTFRGTPGQAEQRERGGPGGRAQAGPRERGGPGGRAQAGPPERGGPAGGPQVEQRGRGGPGGPPQAGQRGRGGPGGQRGRQRYRFNWKTPYILSSHNSRVYYSAGNHVFKSMNKGDSLKTISPEITRTDRGSATALAESHFDPDIVYVGTDDGALWVTRNAGHDWEKIVDFPDDTPKKKTDGEEKDGDKPQAAEKNTEEAAGEPPAAAERPRERRGERGRRGGERGERPRRGGERPERGGERAQRGERGPRGGEGGGRRFGRGGGAQMLERLMENDKNGDGKLQRSEMPERMGRMFDRLDANGDGVIDKKELEQARERMGRRRPPGERPPRGERRRDPPPSNEDPSATAAGFTADADGGDDGFRLISMDQDPKQKTGGQAKKTTGEEKQPPTGEKEKEEEGPPQKEAAEPKPAAKKVEKPEKADEPEKTEQPEKAEKPEKAERPAEQPAEPKEAPAKAEAAPVTGDPISGEWAATVISDQVPAGRLDFNLVLKLASDGTVTGTYNSRMTEGDVVDGRYDRESMRLTFAVDAGRMDIDISAAVGDNKLTGSVEAGGGMFGFEFDAVRDKPPAVKTAAQPAGDGRSEEPAAAPSSKSLTDLLPGPRWVSGIETSRHQAGRVYVTFDGHRSDDDDPYVFASDDEGKSWRSIRANLPASAGSTRVIREDITNGNILYLGTEFGAWVSIERGESWTRFNNNLPTVAVHEIAQHPTSGEIIAATHGRSLWILDVTPIRHMSEQTVADATLYKPNTAIYWRPQPRRGGGGARRFVGQNPESGAQIFYSLPRRARQIRLKVTDMAGDTLSEFEAASEPGLHRVAWNLRRMPDPNQAPPARFRGGRGGFGGGGGRAGAGGRRGFGRRGRLVPSGTYLVSLTVDGKTTTQPLHVQVDPDFPNYRAWEVEEQELEFEAAMAEARRGYVEPEDDGGM